MRKCKKNKEKLKGKKLWKAILEGKAWIQTQWTKSGEPSVTPASNEMIVGLDEILNGKTSEFII